MSEFFCGLLGGCAGVLVGHPFDTVKVKLQTQDFRNPLYKGTVDCFRQTVNRDGMRGLYRGMASPLVGVGGINAVIFGVQRYTNRLFTNQDALSSHFLSGVCAGVTQSVICSPVELTKTRLQIQADRGGPLKYKGAIHCLQEIYRTEGVRGIFRGQLSTVLREAPAFGTYFLSFEVISRVLSGSKTSNEASSGAIFMAGGFAGMSSWLVSYPMDVVKSRIQSDGAFGPKRYNGIMDCIRLSVKEEGYSVFTRGLNSTMIRAFPTNAATFFVVSYTAKMIMKYEDNFEEIENMAVIKEIVQSGQKIMSEVDIVHQSHQLQIKSIQQLVDANKGRYLPVVLSSSEDIWQKLVEEVHHVNAGECLEKDLYIAFMKMIKAKKSAIVKKSSVARKKISYATDLVKQQLLSNAL